MESIGLRKSENLALRGKHCKIPRIALSKVCHSERSEESAFVRLGSELQILRFAQDDSDFHLYRRAAGPCTLGMSAKGVSPNPKCRFPPSDF
jgi:hypothetical protein